MWSLLTVGACTGRGYGGRLAARTVRLVSSAPPEGGQEPEPEPELPPSARNKSGLRPHHYRRYHGQPPRPSEHEPHLNTLRYQRKIWGLHGTRSGVNPAVCWPIKQEWEDRVEYEALAYPDTLQDMVKRFHQEEAEKKRLLDERMASIDAKMANLEKWKREIIEKKRRKEREQMETKARHDKLVEEVREFLGYRVDPKDERFKEVLEKKELEEKKKVKELKKKEKQEKMLERLKSMANQMLDKQGDGKGPEAASKGSTDEQKSKDG